ncbi:hypothetical protein BC936DRAFT_137027 [Jimgerdemannia flammicorona]|uniref:BTB/POZ protein n=1 Tax=Jimgerdemannia flammicorona TaxID=994334 RepID=A0A433CY79_9FUNG|nr:hypothetical protein BC936DRAFT_137027 [Jimgerdemannia flammicorona]
MLPIRLGSCNQFFRSPPGLPNVGSFGAVRATGHRYRQQALNPTAKLAASFTTSTIKFSSATFEWKLDAFKNLKPNKYKSELFWTSERHPWRLSFYPYGDPNIKDSDYVSFYLESEYNDAFQQIHFKRKDVMFELYSRVREVEERQVVKCRTFVKENRSCGWSQFQSRRRLVDALKTDEDPILLKAVIQIPNVEISILAPNPYSEAVTANFLQNCKHSDVVFRVDGRDIFAHGGLLAARSKHFAALLSDGKKETADSVPTGKAVIVVTDGNHEAFLLMLRYLYTGSLDFRGCPEVKAVDLFKVADKYNVGSLRDTMEDCIIDNLTVESVVPILFDFAYKYTSLRKTCLKFIGDNFEAVRKTGALNELESNPRGWEVYSGLMREIAEHVSTGRANN